MEIIFQSASCRHFKINMIHLLLLYNKKLILILFYTIKNIFSTIPFGVIKEKIVI